MKINETLDFKESSRGWCYTLEQEGVITKPEFDKTQKMINDCRKIGLLPLDFVAIDTSREFDFVEPLRENQTPEEFAKDWINSVLEWHKYYDVAFWKNKKIYIQMLVEKIDLKTLFEPICKKYHIPIATAKGWSDILQRGKMIERFKEAEKEGKQVVLLYCGDFDPPAFLISDKIRKNLYDLSKATGWRPDNLEIDRFGLNYDFIISAKLSWINNLKTGKKTYPNDLADPKHPDHYKPYVQNYLKKYCTDKNGVIRPRKVEANAIVVQPQLGRELCEQAILKWLGKNPLSEFEKEKKRVQNKLLRLLRKIGIRKQAKVSLQLLK